MPESDTRSVHVLLLPFIVVPDNSATVGCHRPRCDYRTEVPSSVVAGVGRGGGGEGTAVYFMVTDVHRTLLRFHKDRGSGVGYPS